MNYLLRKLRDPGKLRKIALERLTEPLHLNAAALFVAFFGSFRARVACDLVMRPQYAFGVLRAAEMAAESSIDEIACLELGVASGAGLMNMAQIAAAAERATGVRVRVHGFDTGQGMPKPIDHRDHPELYAHGDFPMDIAKLKAGLPQRAQLHIGPLRETIPEFMEQTEATIGFAALDVDYYSSAVDALRVFDGLPERYLPATLLYVDDMHLRTHHPWGGELLAVSEFNGSRALRKIAAMPFLRTERLFKNAAWIDHFFTVHILDHPARRANGESAPRTIENVYFR